jgi:hypothetical protein
VSDDYKLQASFKYGPGLTGMLNVRANDEEEFKDLLGAAADSAASLGIVSSALEEEFKAAQIVANAFPGTTQVTGQAGAGGARVCPHGPMTYRQSPDGGKSWAGWFCSRQKTDPDRCKPIYDGR